MTRKQHFDKKIEQAKQTLQMLQTALIELETAPEHYHIFLRDSLIQRFKYSIDLFWKLVREFIIAKHGLDIPASPKGVLKVALDMHIINEKEYQVLINAINDRNLTSHAYREQVAVEISSHIVSYYTCMQALVPSLT